MFMLLRILIDLNHFGFSYLIAEGTCDSGTLVVNLQHNLHGFIVLLLEEFLKNMNYEIHRSKIVVEQKHSVQSGGTCSNLWSSNCLRTRTSFVIVTVNWT